MKRIEAFAMSLFMIIVSAVYAAIVIDAVAIPKNVAPYTTVWWWLLIPSVLLLGIAALIIIIATFSKTKQPMTKEQWRRIG